MFEELFNFLFPIYKNIKEINAETDSISIEKNNYLISIDDEKYKIAMIEISNIKKND